MLELMVTTDDDEREQQIEEYDPLAHGLVSAHHCERRVRRADGSSLWAMVHTSVVTDEDGEPVLWVTHLEDVTERKAFEAASREAYARKTEALERLAEIDRTKSDFVSMVSHELRTPVTSILGYLELLEDGDFGELEPRQRDALLVVQQSASRLEHLIADLMTLRQFDTHAPVPRIRGPCRHRGARPERDNDDDPDHSRAGITISFSTLMIMPGSCSVMSGNSNMSSATC